MQLPKNNRKYLPLYNQFRSWESVPLTLENVSYVFALIPDSRIHVEEWTFHHVHLKYISKLITLH